MERADAAGPFSEDPVQDAAAPPSFASAVTFDLNEQSLAEPLAVSEAEGIAPTFPDFMPGNDVELESKPMPEMTYALRDPAMRERFIEELGGNDETEAAISRALQYLARTQEKNGRWNIQKHGGENGHDGGRDRFGGVVFYGAWRDPLEMIICTRTRSPARYPG